MSNHFPSLPNIEYLIDGNGDITIGRVSPFSCAVTACNKHQTFAMLVHRDDETLPQLLMRLETAINNGPDNRI